VKIALFTTSFPANAQNTMNSGVFVRDFAEALADLGHEVWVLTPRKKDSRHEFRHQRTIFFPWLGQEDSLTHIGMKNPVGALRLASVVAMGRVAAAKLIREFQPDHVLCFWVFPSGFWARGPTLRATTSYSVWALGSDIWLLGKMAGMRRVLRAIGRGAVRAYADGTDLAKDFSAITGTPVEFLATSRVLVPPEDVPVGEGGYFLYVGRYHPNKGIDLLVEAVARARPSLPSDFRLRVHGFGPLEAEVRDAVHERGIADIVEVLGPTQADEVALVIRRARGLIVPSRIESLPVVMCDALQMDVPILVTDVGDMGRLVREHDAGIVCQPNASSLAASLVEFARAPGGSASGRDTLRRLLDIRESARHFLADIGAEPR
jgi:glycosyltransferase involved in cell wall biosynthesis